MTPPLNRFFDTFVFIITLIISSSLFSQTVSVDDTSYTEEQLVNQLVESTCISKSNFNISSNQSVASFNNNGGSFPISKGIIIRTGTAKNSEGSFTNTNLSTENSTNGDTDLQQINEQEGDISNITDVGFLEFNFTPIGKKISFNYIFASNEYGEFQCKSRDLFAIILTNIDTGDAINIATIPESDTNISVENIRDNQHNGICDSSNIELFGSYYGNNSNNSTINMRGFTEVINASATVIPNNEYQIKFVIGDYSNSDYDSAVFIAPGIFTNTLDLGSNKEICDGEEVVLDSGFSKTDNYKFEWTKNGIPLTEIGTEITVNTPDTYGLTITSLTDVSCQLKDEIKITTIKATKPDDVSICTDNTIINIPNRIDSIILNGLTAANYNINYYTTEDNANNNLDPITAPANYTIPSNSFTLWARLSNKDKTCFDVVSFNIKISAIPLVDNLPDVQVCDEYTLPTLTNGEYYTAPSGGGTKLSAGEKITNNSTIYIYNEDAVSSCSNETSFKVSLARNFEIALEHCGSYTIPNTSLGKFYKKQNGVDEIPVGTILTEDTTVHFYSELNSTVCQDTPFNLIIHPLPLVDTIDDIITCGSVTLAPLTNGNYYTGSNGSGTLLNAGDIINETKDIYIYNIDTDSDCSNESIFKITIINPSNYTDITACGNYRIPTLANGKYYTDSTRDTEIRPGTNITATQNVYYYADEITTSTNCTGYNVTITINPLPEVDTINDIIKCVDDLPTLPALVNGNYFTGPKGSGTPLFEGDEINRTQTIYIFNKNPSTGCDDETSFRVTIKPIPTIPDFFDVSVCEPYILPTLSFGGKFFTEANGAGTQLNPGEAIEETQVVYIYNQDPDIATCANEKSFTVNILDVKVDVFDDVKACVFYELPALTKPGNYYQNSNKTGLLNAGDVIDTTQTIYIIGDDTRFFPCQNNSSFTVTVFAKPNLGVLDDIDLCGSVTLPTISIPNIIVEYYRGPNKTDLIDLSEYTITNVTSVTETQEIYVHAYQEEHPDCFIDDVFSITIYPLLDLNVLGGAICVDNETNQTNNPFLIETGLDPTSYDIRWFLEGNLLNPDSSMSDWNALKAGTYTIEATKINPIGNADCNYKPTEVIIQSSTPEFEIKFLTDNFSDFYAVEIKTINEGLGNYQYALDDGVFQESNFFGNIKPGTYTITIKDLTGICNNLTLELVALDYPKFFTPNNDNKNDRWNISDLKNDLKSTITIYDRYGKLINIIKPSELGWDGFNFNGNKMPNTDYWFVLKYTKEGKEAIFRSHFSLLR
ncbi:T9SS type B sorting domain-containing protein [Polaribacter sp. L3A8]|uniref:T9SS type B sorting domain-containing protein n=1 Tax=Polaribacter sp. L3A8 TaxID=2686361 RepID=UPI00131E841D|nr:T9SS type B sorting domain-containing protein [Polaribacter sp. L3A8]